MQNGYTLGFRLGENTSYNDDDEDMVLGIQAMMYAAVKLANKADAFVEMLETQQGRPATGHTEGQDFREVYSQTSYEQVSPSTTGHPEGMLWEDVRYGSLGDTVEQV